MVVFINKLHLESLEKKYEIKNEFDKVIGNTENAFVKVLYF